jgi:hypothetical protein
VLTTRQPSTVWCSRERLPAAAAQPAKVRAVAPRIIIIIIIIIIYLYIRLDVLRNTMKQSV